MNKHASKKLNKGRGVVGKLPVVGARSRDGRVVAKVVEKTDKDTLHGFINSNVEKGSTVCTDEHRAYEGLSENYDHKTVNHSAKQFVDDMAHTNGAESVWALLKRSFYGTYHSFSFRHAQLYVNETTFRLNEGKCEIDTVDRIDSLAIGTKGKRLTYAMLKAA
jgi:transposase-like protein